MVKGLLPIAVALGGLYLLSKGSTSPSGAAGTPSESNYTFAGVPNKPDGGNYIARLIQTAVPAPTIKSPEGGDTKLPQSVETAGQTFTASQTTQPLPVVQSRAMGFNPVLNTPEVNTTYSSARLGPSGIERSNDYNFKVETATAPSGTNLKVVESFSSGGFDAFGTRLPQGTLGTAAAVFGSSGSSGKSATGQSVQFIPVVENGVTNWYSPSTFASTYGAKK